MAQARWTRPQLYPSHHEEGEERKVSWLELFYDLVYVATIIQLGNALSHHVSVAGVLTFIALFVPIWWSWSGITFFFNRILVDDIWHRVMIFAQMFAVAAMAIMAGDAIGERGAHFALAYVGVRAILILLYVRAGRHISVARPLVQRYLIGFSLAALVWLVSAFVEPPLRYYLWGAGMLIDFATALTPASRRLAAALPPNLEHMSERYGLLTIIVLGEAFVKVIGYASEAQLALSAAVYGLVGLVIACSLWWLYFDRVAGSEIRQEGQSPFIWVYAHLPLTMGLTTYGVAITKLVLLAPGTPLADHYRWLICGAVLVSLLFISILERVTVQQGQLHPNRRWLIRVAAVAAVLVLGAVGGLLGPVLFIVLLAIVCVSQVALDLGAAARTQNDNVLPTHPEPRYEHGSH